ncbi:MAG: hypothetical protein K6G56_01955 [Clostridiales bacterium]|nr:hypothetical protein [Clostridiales bacterium]
MKDAVSAKNTAAVICFVIGALLLITIPFNIAGEMDTKLLIAGGVLGALMIYMGIRTKMTVSKFKEYSGYLSEDPTGSIDKLASKCGEPVEKVKSNLERMILRRYFINAHIDEETNSIVLEGKEEQPSDE